MVQLFRKKSDNSSSLEEVRVRKLVFLTGKPGDEKVVEHPIAPKIIEGLFPMLTDTQHEDGGWGKQNLKAFRILHSPVYL